MKKIYAFPYFNRLPVVCHNLLLAFIFLPTGKHTINLLMLLEGEINQTYTLSYIHSETRTSLCERVSGLLFDKSWTSMNPVVYLLIK